MHSSYPEPFSLTRVWSSEINIKLSLSIPLMGDFHWPHEVYMECHQCIMECNREAVDLFSQETWVHIWLSCNNCPAPLRPGFDTRPRLMWAEFPTAWLCTCRRIRLCTGAHWLAPAHATQSLTLIA